MRPENKQTMKEMLVGLGELRTQLLKEESYIEIKRLKNQILVLQKRISAARRLQERRRQLSFGTSFKGKR